MDLKLLLSKQCTPCTKKTHPLNKAEITFYLNLLPNWTVKNGKLERHIKTKNFEESLQLGNLIGKLAEEENHHPDLFISWALFKINIFTHAIKNLSVNDFILAAKIDELISKFKSKDQFDL